MVRTALSWLVLAAAVAIAGYSWYRAATATWVGGVHWIEWRTADGAPLAGTDRGVAGCDRSHDSDFEAMVHGDRLIVSCRTGYALIEVARGIGTLLPVADKISRLRTLAVVPGPGDQIALLWDGGDPDTYDINATVVAIAEGARWRVPPTKIAWSMVKATAWVEGAFEIAQYEHLSQAESDKLPVSAGRFQTVVTRVTGDGVTRRMLPPCELCITNAVFHGGSRGWVRIINQPLPPTFDRRVDRLVPEHGPVEDLESGPRTPDGVKMITTDGLATGVVSSGGTAATQVLGRDGYLHESPLRSPAPGFRPAIWGRLRVAGGAVERHRVWLDDQFGHWAQLIGDRPLFTLRGEHDGEVLVGDDPKRMQVAVRDCGELVLGVWMEARGGLALVRPDSGCYALFDHQLERLDRGSLRDHLRTNGSRTREVSTPEAEWKLAVALFGLLPCLLVAAVVGALTRRRLVPARRRFVLALAVGAGVYAVVALDVLRDVLPLLS